MDVGNHVMVVKGVRIVPVSDTRHSLDVCVEMDVSYAGGLRVVIVTSLNIGIIVPVSVRLNAFSGKVRPGTVQITYLHF